MFLRRKKNAGSARLPALNLRSYNHLEQQIGKHYRCFRRNSSTCWKGNWGDLKFEEHELTERHKVWIDESARVFGYDLDICALDVLHLKDGREVVLEV